jgi:muramoyltetrapeptide carboxypeptidase
MPTAVNHIKPLAPGNLVAIVAPAGPASAEQVAQVPELYARYGLQARVYPGCHLQSGEGGADYLAGDDSARVADLHAALADPEVAAIHSLRGGYGCMRLLPHIDAALVKRAAKLLVGYSDVTALHALWHQQGLPAVHGPMAASDMVKPGRQADTDALFAALQQGFAPGQVLQPTGGTPMPGVHQAGTAQGPLIGGNLSLVAALLGTPWAWQPQGAVLFIEDINEEPYRVDRLLTQLQLAGVLQAVAGFVVGSFDDSASPALLLRQMLLPRGVAGKPVLSGWPTGHGSPNRPLPLGLRVRLDVVAAGGGTLTVSD